jgi:hypothetical protein
MGCANTRSKRVEEMFVVEFCQISGRESNAVTEALL